MRVLLYPRLAFGSSTLSIALKRHETKCSFHANFSFLLQESSSGNSREGSISPPSDAHLSINNNNNNSVANRTEGNRSPWLPIVAAPSANPQPEVKQKTPRKQKKSQITPTKQPQQQFQQLQLQKQQLQQQKQQQQPTLPPVSPRENLAGLCGEIVSCSALGSQPISSSSSSSSSTATSNTFANATTSTQGSGVFLGNGVIQRIGASPTASNTPFYPISANPASSMTASCALISSASESSMTSSVASSVASSTASSVALDLKSVEVTVSSGSEKPASNGLVYTGGVASNVSGSNSVARYNNTFSNSSSSISSRNSVAVSSSSSNGSGEEVQGVVVKMMSPILTPTQKYGRKRKLVDDECGEVRLID